MKKCDVCGYETSRDEHVCPACGEQCWREVAPVTQPSAEPAPEPAKKARR